MRRRAAVVATTLALVVLAAGCGSSNPASERARPLDPVVVADATGGTGTARFELTTSLDGDDEPATITGSLDFVNHRMRAEAKSKARGEVTSGGEWVVDDDLMYFRYTGGFTGTPMPWGTVNADGRGGPPLPVIG